MPKEVIHDDHPDVDGWPVTNAVIGWGRDTYAQVGIESDRHFIDLMLTAGINPDAVVENMTHLGRSALIAARELHPGIVTDFRTKDEEDRFMFDVGCAITEHLRLRYPAWTSIWVNPTRAGLNKMIRLLRTARDQAFGKDE